jgi:Secretion system C-terminal sorting domain
MQLTPSWSQLYFNNVYDEPNFFSEVSYHLEKSQDGLGFVVPSWNLEDSTFVLAYGLRILNDSGETTSFHELDSLSTTTFSGVSACNFKSTSDGGYVYGGMLDSACIIKTTPDYQMQWRTNVGVFGGSIRSVNELANGQFFCTWVDLTQQSDGIELYWFNPNGSLTNTIHYSVAESGMYEVTDVKQLINGDILVTLFLEENWHYDNIISRINGANGDVLWQRRFSIGTFIPQLGISLSLIENANEATIAFSTKDSFPDQFNPNGDYFGRMGTFHLNLADGDTSEVKYFGGLMHQEALLDFEKTPDNGYIILAFETNPLYTWKKQLIKLDSNRNEEWRKEYNPLPLDQMDSQYAEILDVDVCPDSGYVVSGWTQDTKTVPTFHNGKQVPWVFKTDACGDLVWNNCGITSTPKPNVQSVNDKSISVYPNPSSGIVNISCSSTFNSIFIKDLTGRTIHSTTNKNHLLQTTLDVSNLSDGVYLILVDFENGTQGSTQLVVE